MVIFRSYVSLPEGTLFSDNGISIECIENRQPERWADEDCARGSSTPGCAPASKGPVVATLCPSGLHKLPLQKHTVHRASAHEFSTKWHWTGWGNIEEPKQKLPQFWRFRDHFPLIRYGHLAIPIDPVKVKAWEIIPLKRRYFPIFPSNYPLAI